MGVCVDTQPKCEGNLKVMNGNELSNIFPECTRTVQCVLGRKQDISHFASTHLYYLLLAAGSHHYYLLFLLCAASSVVEWIRMNLILTENASAIPDYATIC